MPRASDSDYDGYDIKQFGAARLPSLAAVLPPGLNASNKLLSDLKGLLRDKRSVAAGVDLAAVMAAPPTATFSASGAGVPAGLTLAYLYNAAGVFMYAGGTPTLNGYSDRYQFRSVAWTGTGNNLSDGQANAWSVSFFTDAPKLCLKTGIGQALRVAIEGVYTQAALLTPVNAGSNLSYLTLDFTTRKTRLVRLESSQDQQFLGVYVDPASRLWAPKKSILVSWIGDSHVVGSIADANCNAYSRRVGHLMGWDDVRQIAWGGSGYINPGTPARNTYKDRVAEAAAVAPQVLVFSGGGNDGASTQAAIQAAALLAWQTARAALPNTPIIILGAFSGNSGPSTPLLTVETALAAAFAQWADSNSVWIPVCQDPAGAWFTAANAASYGNADGIHNNDAGHLYAAQRAAIKIQQWLM